jgi:hypothetical protein
LPFVRFYFDSVFFSKIPVLPLVQNREKKMKKKLCDVISKLNGSPSPTLCIIV